MWICSQMLAGNVCGCQRSLRFGSWFSCNISSHLHDCSINAKIVLDLAWEKINTGHWKDVDANWRYVYTLASLFKVLCLLAEKRNKTDIIKACDMGLLMGAPLMQNILSKIAAKLTDMLLKERGCAKKIKRIKLSPESEGLKLIHNISRKNSVSHDEFYKLYVAKKEPVLLLDAIKDWPAFGTNRWSVECILNKAGYRTVPIEIGSKYTDDNWTQKLMTVEDFVESYIWNKSCQKEIGYLAQHNIFDQIPELFDDIAIPTYITTTEVDISIYFGPGGTISPLHFDPKHNLLAQVIGEKYIRLYPKEATDFLYPRTNSWLSNTSQVDVENPDLEAFPLFPKAPYLECILREGDLLYIPPGCWHYVRSLSTSLSISFWW
ncbi:lysine-specific demethylase 8-like isoform X3 [Stegodyphus dumicola]|uniref:lysine-specific demethylase 8-like isoform X3 n=1 Tax=Stegodyphus dumicola TaxID=202533 RepID=UPI0015B1425D|nr:lysine-specific demethylase 8-like isoform X3 [Stegodyphus dumicola]XP_035214492.1 lysine-specific demethylase 8-like isoform X3 [Stegodyphus dumicola]